MESFLIFKRQLLGKGCLSVIRPLVVAMIIGIGLTNSGFRLDIQPVFLLLPLCLLSFSMTVKSVQSLQQERRFDGLVQLPSLKNGVLGLVLAEGLYVLLTKVLVMAVILFSLGSATGFSILACVLGCLLSLVWGMLYLVQRHKLGTVLTLALIIVTGVLFHPQIVFLLGVVLGCYQIRKKTLYDFAQWLEVSEEKTRASGKGTFYLYFQRYFSAQPTYLNNSIALLALAVLLPIVFFYNEMGDFYLIGLGVISVNTPLTILLSSNKNLLAKIKTLPNQVASFFLPYFLLLLSWNFFIAGIFLITSKLVGFTVTNGVLFLALLVVFLNSGGTVFMELRFPLTKWHVVSDLWHHPRKYIIPIIVILLVSGGSLLVF